MYRNERTSLAFTYNNKALRYRASQVHSRHKHNYPRISQSRSRTHIYPNTPVLNLVASCIQNGVNVISFYLPDTIHGGPISPMCLACATQDVCNGPSRAHFLRLPSVLILGLTSVDGMYRTVVGFAVLWLGTGNRIGGVMWTRQVC